MKNARTRSSFYVTKNYYFVLQQKVQVTRKNELFMFHVFKKTAIIKKVRYEFFEEHLKAILNSRLF